MKNNTQYLDDLDETSTRVDGALIVDDMDSFSWDDKCDVLVVGVGMAGAAATLRAAEDPQLDILAIDRGLGGGASAISGGIVYMGGGTNTQKDAGIEDSPENMANYLRYETGDIVRPETLKRFAYASTSFESWLEKHGVRFGGPFTDAKTSYPNGASLYFSGNERTVAGRALATPAPRGHRAKPSKGGEPTQLSGGYLLKPLLSSIEQQPNVRFSPQTRATRMVVDKEGAVVGVEIQRIPSSIAGKLHGLFYRASNMTALAVLNLLGPVRKATMKLENKWAKTYRIRVNHGVVLAAGGFTYNREMMAKSAPEFLESAPLGTIADDGSGIKLGMTAGGTTDKMDVVSAWRFIYPPASWTKSVSIGPEGERLLSEEVYGARTGEAVFKHGSGKGWLILDQPLQAAVLEEAKSLKLFFFQRVQLNATLNRYTVSAPTLPELAKKIKVPVNKLVATIETYNQQARNGQPDPEGKSDNLRYPLETGPFYATDIGASCKLAPIAALTMGGLIVDEESGQVLDSAGQPVKGLFAAGRTAVGICSHYYVSGLSLADCIWSGWRAAETLKGNVGAKTLAPDI